MKEIRAACSIWRDDKYCLFQQISITILWGMISKRPEWLGMLGMMIGSVCFNRYLQPCF